MRTITVILAALSLLAFAGTRSMATPPTPPAVPDTAAGHALQAWLAAFDSGDRATIEQFLAAYCPDKLPHLDDEYALRQSTGGFDLRKIVTSSPGTITVLIQERASDRFLSMTLFMQTGAPNRIDKRKMKPVERPAEFALPHLSQTELVAAVRERIQREVAADRFAGAVLIAHSGKPVFSAAYGLANRNERAPNTLDTRFRLGSMNKMFTAVAIMQLVEAGKVDLDKPFGSYLDAYPNKTVSGSVTIRELLNHTGGTGDIFTPEYEKRRTQMRTLQDYIDLYGERALEFTPGSRWEYSNYGYILLGAVIEKVSGEDYYAYVRDHIYAPADMTATASDPENAAVGGRSTGYMKQQGEWTPNTDRLPYRGTSAGGGYSTVSDLLRFANALEAHRLLDAQHTDMLTTGTVESPIGKDGMGFFDETFDGIRCFGHSGGAPGMNGVLNICPDAAYTIVVLANEDPPVAERIADFITYRLPIAQSLAPATIR